MVLSHWKDILGLHLRLRRYNHLWNELLGRTSKIISVNSPRYSSNAVRLSLRCGLFAPKYSMKEWSLILLARRVS